MRTEWRKAYEKAYYKKNKKKINIRRKQRYIENRESELARNNAWNNANIEFVRATNRKLYRKYKEEDLKKMVRRRQIERKYKERRKELYEKRKAEGYYRTEDYRAKERARYKRNTSIQKAANKKYRAKKKILDENKK